MHEFPYLQASRRINCPEYCAGIEFLRNRCQEFSLFFLPVFIMHVHYKPSTMSHASLGSQVTAAAEAYKELRLHDALEAVVAIANRGNLYMEQVAPWTAFKKVRPPTAIPLLLRRGFCPGLWLHLVRALPVAGLVSTLCLKYLTSICHAVLGWGAQQLAVCKDTVAR